MTRSAESRQSRTPALPEDGRTGYWAGGTWVVSVLYYARLFDERWIPFDEGTLGQPAVRILRGEVPHRDFDAMYTGLLEYLHAGAMSVLGVHLLTPRFVMLLAVMLWVPALWALSRRLTGWLPGAAALTVLAVIVGPPNYPAAMPSWYNLFFATWGAWSLVRWSEGGRPAWLVATGAFAGLSMLFKVTGLYLLAGALFFVLHAEARNGGTLQGTRGREGALVWFGASAVGVLLIVEHLLVWPQISPTTWIQYVLPTAVLGVVLIRDAAAVQDSRAAVARAVRGWAVVCLGAAGALLPFLGWYASVGGLDDLYRGLLVLPLQRVDTVALEVPPLTRTWTILAVTALLVGGARAGRGLAFAMAGSVLVAGAWLLVHMDPAVFRGLFDSLRLLVPVVAVAGAWALAREARLVAPPPPALLATLWVVALVNLIRFPFAGPVYFTYVAPLGVLALGGAVATLGGMRRGGGVGERLARRPVLVAVALLYAAFFVGGPNRGGLFSALPPPPAAHLPLERGRIQVPLSEAAEYVQLVDAVRSLSAGPYVYATPDAPEVSFLAGLRNPTRTLFEVFEDADTRTASTLRALEAHDVNVVVVNTRPHFSTAAPGLLQELARRYPQSRRIGRFVVRWQEVGEP